MNGWRAKKRILLPEGPQPLHRLYSDMWSIVWASYFTVFILFTLPSCSLKRGENRGHSPKATVNIGMHRLTTSPTGQRAEPLGKIWSGSQWMQWTQPATNKLITNQWLCSSNRIRRVVVKIFKNKHWCLQNGSPLHRSLRQLLFS